MVNRIKRRSHVDPANGVAEGVIERAKAEVEERWKTVMNARLREQARESAKRYAELQKKLENSNAMGQTLQDSLTTINQQLIELRRQNECLRETGVAVAASQETSEHDSIDMKEVLAVSKTVTPYADGVEVKPSKHQEDHESFMQTFASRGLPLSTFHDGSQGTAYMVGNGIQIRFDHGAYPMDHKSLAAKSVMFLLGAILKHQKGTLVTDPIVYIREVGIFVKGATSRQAAIVAQSIRDYLDNQRF